MDALPRIGALCSATRALIVYRIEAWVVAFGPANRESEGISALGVDE
jgi:hypothetical protein